ncbi:MAG: hypothetical protein K0Q59_2159 [Paenibacillus sp.]|nr:hypothetical protein [Paenibacillus sp.]
MDDNRSRISDGSQKSSEDSHEREEASLDPFEINFLPQFVEGREPREPFVNEHGVTIGDHLYESEQSPLTKWTEQTDPFVMVGDQWVHPFKDIGFQTAENRDYFEKGIIPSTQGATFTHPDKDVAYGIEPGDDTGTEDKPK